MRRLAAVMLASLALSACAASPTMRVRTALLQAGVPQRMANCLADRLVERLSYDQLRELGQIAKLPREDTGKLTIHQLVKRVSAIGDPKIVEVVTSSGIGCAIAS